MPQFIVFGLYYTVCSSPVLLPLLIVSGIFYKHESLGVIFVPVFVLCFLWLFLAVPFLANNAAYARTVFGKDFFDSASFGWKRLRQVFAVIPGLGRWSKRNSDGEED